MIHVSHNAMLIAVVDRLVSSAGRQRLMPWVGSLGRRSIEKAGIDDLQMRLNIRPSVVMKLHFDSFSLMFKEGWEP